MTAFPLISLYSVMIDNLAGPLVRAKVRRCSSKKCQKFFVLIGGGDHGKHTALLNVGSLTITGATY